MGVAVSTKFFKRGRQDKKVGNHCFISFLVTTLSRLKSVPYAMLAAVPLAKQAIC